MKNFFSKLLLISGVLFISFNTFSAEHKPKKHGNKSAKHAQSEEIKFPEGSIAKDISLELLLNNSDFNKFNGQIYALLEFYLNHINESQKYKSNFFLNRGSASFALKIEFLNYLIHLIDYLLKEEEMQQKIEDDQAQTTDSLNYFYKISKDEGKNFTSTSEGTEDQNIIDYVRFKENAALKRLLLKKRLGHHLYLSLKEYKEKLLQRLAELQEAEKRSYEVKAERAREDQAKKEREERAAEEKAEADRRKKQSLEQKRLNQEEAAAAAAAKRREGWDQFTARAAEMEESNPASPDKQGAAKIKVIENSLRKITDRLDEIEEEKRVTKFNLSEKYQKLHTIFNSFNAVYSEIMKDQSDLKENTKDTYDKMLQITEKRDGNHITIAKQNKDFKRGLKKLNDQTGNLFRDYQAQLLETDDSIIKLNTDIAKLEKEEARLHQELLNLERKL